MYIGVYEHAVIYLNLFLSANALHVNLVSYQEFPEGYSIIVLDHSKFILLCFKNLDFLEYQPLNSCKLNTFMDDNPQ